MDSRFFRPSLISEKKEPETWEFEIIGTCCTFIITLFVVFWISILKQCDIGDTLLAIIIICTGMGLIVFMPGEFVPTITHSLAIIAVFAAIISVLIIVSQMIKECIYKFARNRVH